MKENATIVRVARRRDNPFVMISRDALQDRSMSYAARGLLAYLLSKPDDWQVVITDLCRAAQPEGKETSRYAVYGLLRELIAAGYITRTSIHESGRLRGCVYHVYETPQTEQKIQRCEIQNAENKHIYIEENNTKNVRKPRTLSQQIKRAARVKRQHRQDQERWLQMDNEQLREELNKYRNFSRKDPNNRYFYNCIDYISRLLG